MQGRPVDNGTCIEQQGCLDSVAGWWPLCKGMDDDDDVMDPSLGGSDSTELANHCDMKIEMQHLRTNRSSDTNYSISGCSIHFHHRGIVAS